MATTSVKTYVWVSGVIFCLMALGHLIRAIYGVDIEIAGMTVPISASWIAFVAAGLLCCWAFNVARK